MFNLLSFLLLPLLGSINSNSFPDVLSDEEEKHYLSLWHNKDFEARNTLIEHNLRLVAHIAKKYENTFEDKDDILSIGIIGLIKAVDSFNYSAKNKLATYAAKCIENEILMHLRSNKNKRNYTWLSTPIGIDKDGNEI
jgi:RNA polymerase sporulation-specific sigma factor